MRTTLRFPKASIIIAAVLWLDQGAGPVLAGDTSDYPADPRPVVADFYQAVRAGDAGAARKCWTIASRGDAAAMKYDETQIRNTIAEWIANYRLEQALEKKLPSVYQEMQRAGKLTPTSEQLKNARFLTFRRLAIVRWNDDEEAAFPMELNTGVKPAVWLICTDHYRETTRASVGDSFRSTNVMSKVTDRTTKVVLDGKVRDANGLLETQLKFMNEELEKLPKEKE